MPRYLYSGAIGYRQMLRMQTANILALQPPFQITLTWYCTASTLPELPLTKLRFFELTARLESSGHHALLHHHFPRVGHRHHRASNNLLRPLR